MRSFMIISANIIISHILPKTRFIGLHFESSFNYLTVNVVG